MMLWMPPLVLPKRLIWWICKSFLRMSFRPLEKCDGLVKAVKTSLVAFYELEMAY